MNQLSPTYIRLLERWLRSSIPYLYRCTDRPGLTCYGTGENFWGVQTNLKAFAAYAVLGTHPSYDPEHAGLGQADVRTLALEMLRFSLESHIEGSYHCTDGDSWGHTWISGLGLERMVHGLEVMEPYLTADDKRLLRKVFISECDWLLDEYEIVAGLYGRDGNNKPESNLWNGCILYRTAQMYPDCPRAEQYLAKAQRFFVNSLSTPSDAHSDMEYDGYKVSDLHAGANFFESFALNHHGYMNVGYMNICLSNVAMLHFSCKRNGWKPPQALYHHVRELWELVKFCTFQDGRLLRIGGDSRVRYAYCQDYALPAWLLARALYADEESTKFEKKWIKLISTEMEANVDGSFFSSRCKEVANRSPLYYTRLESDRAVSLSFALAWEDLAGISQSMAGTAQRPAAPVGYVPNPWHDEYHGAYLHRSETRIASWVWQSSEKPQGLCLPQDASNLAEWRENLAGSITGLGKVTSQVIEGHGGNPYPRGFITWGRTIIHTEGLMSEGRSEEKIARNQILCAALPDDRQMVVLQYAAALDRRIFVRSLKGLHLLIPNDVMNYNHRMYYHAGGHSAVHGYGSASEVIRTGSKWLNVDNKLGVVALYGTDELVIHRPGKRQIGLKRTLKHEGLEDSLYADELCGSYHSGLKSFNPGEVIWNAGYVLLSGMNKETTAMHEASMRPADRVNTGRPHVCIVRLRGMDNQEYYVAANFGDIAEQVMLPVNTSLVNLAQDEHLPVQMDGTVNISLPAGQGGIYKILT